MHISLVLKLYLRPQTYQVDNNLIGKVGTYLGQNKQGKCTVHFKCIYLSGKEQIISGRAVQFTMRFHISFLRRTEKKLPRMAVQSTVALDIV